MAQGSFSSAPGGVQTSRLDIRAGSPGEAGAHELHKRLIEFRDFAGKMADEFGEQSCIALSDLSLDIFRFCERTSGEIVNASEKDDDDIAAARFRRRAA